MMFIYELSAKFFSLFMSLVLFFGNISFAAPWLGNVKVDYAFANDNALSAAGIVTVTAPRDGSYDLYWGNGDGEKLSVEVEGYTATYSEFTTVDVVNGTGCAEIYSFTAIPDGAQTIIACKGLLEGSVTALPENKLHETTEPVYRFGALSDLHFNRYAASLTDDGMVTFPNALHFFDAFDVQLVGMSGDLSSGGEENAFKKFNYVSSKFDFPVYTCTGNHDISQKNYKIENWQKYVNTGVYGEEKREGVTLGVNGLDFVYAPKNTNDDVFIFFSQTAWAYNDPENPQCRLVSEAQLDWLEQQLEAYRDRTVYLFFHTFFANDNGDIKTGEGNIVNNKDVYYNLVYTLGTPDEARFRSLLKTYKNVVFFNGHSHWAFSMQKFNPILNITDYDGTYATMVHISSVSSPRTVKADSDKKKENYMKMSEGYLVSVYDDYILLQGVEFLRGKLLSYATYKIDK